MGGYTMVYHGTMVPWYHGTWYQGGVLQEKVNILAPELFVLNFSIFWSSLEAFFSRSSPKSLWKNQNSEILSFYWCGTTKILKFFHFIGVAIGLCCVCRHEICCVSRQDIFCVSSVNSHDICCVNTMNRQAI